MLSFFGLEVKKAFFVSLNRESNFGALPALVLNGLPSEPLTVPNPRCSKVIMSVYPSFSHTLNNCLK